MAKLIEKVGRQAPRETLKNSLENVIGLEIKKTYRGKEGTQEKRT